MKDQSAFLYLDDLINSKEPIYVRNTSKDRGNPGIVVVTMNDGARAHREVVPNTRIPVCLSSKVTPAMIQNSSSLRQYLDAGILELVSKSDAERELSVPGNQDKLRAAYERIGYKNRDVMRMRKKDDNFSGSSGTDVPVIATGAESIEQFKNNYNDDIGDAAPEDEDSSDDAEANVNTRVLSLVESLANREMKSRHVKAELEALELSNDDLTYLIENTSGIVQKYAKEEYSQRTGAGADDVGGGIEDMSAD